MPHYYKKFIFIFFSYCIFLSAHAMENREKLINRAKNIAEIAQKKQSHQDIALKILNLLPKPNETSPLINSKGIGEIAEKEYLSQKDWEDIEKLVEDGADPNTTVGFMQTPLLMKAIEHKNYATAKFLLEHQADPYARDKYDGTSLPTILRKQRNGPLKDEDVQMFGALLKSGKQLDQERHLAKINGKIANTSYPTLLAWTVKERLSPLTQLLIDYGADVISQENAAISQGRKSLLAHAINNHDHETTKILCNAKVPLVNIDPSFPGYNAYHLAVNKSKTLIKTLMTHGHIDLRNPKNKQVEKKTEGWTSWIPWNCRKQNVPIEQTIWGTLLAFNHTDSVDKKPQPNELSYLPQNIKNHILSKFLLVSKEDPHLGLCRMLLGLKIYDNIVLPILTNKHTDCIGKMLSDSNNMDKKTPLQILYVGYQYTHFIPQHISKRQKLFDGTKINKHAKVFSDAFSQNGDSNTTENILESIPKNNLCRQIAEIHYLSLPTNK